MRPKTGQRHVVRFDFGVSFTPEDLAAGRALCNYGEVLRESQDMFGTHVFVKDDGGAIGRGRVMPRSASFIAIRPAIWTCFGLRDPHPRRFAPRPLPRERERWVYAEC